MKKRNKILARVCMMQMWRVLNECDIFEDGVHILAGESAEAYASFLLACQRPGAARDAVFHWASHRGFNLILTPAGFIMYHSGRCSR